MNGKGGSRTVGQWIADNAIGIIVLGAMLLGGAYAYGNLNSDVSHVYALEQKLEAGQQETSKEIADINERLARIEGYVEAQAMEGVSQ